MQPKTLARPALVLALLAALAVGGAVLADLSSTPDVDWLEGRFAGTRDEVQTLMDYYESIALTPEQEAIRVAALSEMPAPCCSDFSAATCCCKCNLSRSLWGLSKYLITEKGADAAQVQTAAKAWIATLNPDGYSGKVCSTGQCGRRFADDGCGGMNPAHLAF